MKYIKVFEDYNDYNNKEITLQEWLKLLFNYIPFSETETNDILNYSKINKEVNISYELEPNDNFLLRRIKLEKSLNYILLYKIPDDYYLLKFEPFNSREDHYYKCDDIEGTLNIIKSFFDK